MCFVSIAFIFSLPRTERIGAEVHLVLCSQSPLGILNSHTFICTNIECDVFFQELGLSTFIHCLLETEFPSSLNLFILWLQYAISEVSSPLSFYILM